MIYAFDSDIISYMIKGDKEIREKFDNMINNNLYSIPPSVYYEVKRWLILKKANVQLQAFNELYEDSIKSDMTFEMWEKSIEIYTSLISQGTPIAKDGKETDIFTSAFCILNDYVLITNNSKHFKNIQELEIIDDWKKKSD